jgi:hypothetical protein
MMSEHEFDQRLKRIEEQYADHRAGAEAYRDQEVSRLFVECGWTQTKIGERMGRNVAWVSRRLLFGRFLQFCQSGKIANAPLKSIPEGRFRDSWSAAGKRRKESEEERFARVLTLLRERQPELPRGYQNLVKKPGIRPAVVELCKDGQRRSAEQIAEALQEQLPGTDTRQVGAALRELQKKPPPGLAVEARHAGRTHKYRMVPRRGAAPVPVNPEEAGVTVAEVLPMLTEVQAELKKSSAALSTSFIMERVARVQQALKRLLIPAEVV